MIPFHRHNNSHARAVVAHSCAFVVLIAPFALAVAADKIPPASPPPSSTGSIFAMFFGLIVVLGIMAGIAWLLKRSGLTNMAGNGVPMKVIGGISVGTREKVMVIEVADQWLVIGVAPGRVNTLATLPRQEFVANTAGAPTAKNFSSWLKQTIEKRHDRS